MVLDAGEVAAGGRPDGLAVDRGVLCEVDLVLLVRARLPSVVPFLKLLSLDLFGLAFRLKELFIPEMRLADQVIDNHAVGSAEDGQVPTHDRVDGDPCRTVVTLVVQPRADQLPCVRVVKVDAIVRSEDDRHLLAQHRVVFDQWWHPVLRRGLHDD